MNYHNILITKIELMITNDLTIGRNDNDLIPFTNDEIHKFIEDNNDNIEECIRTMIDEYSNEIELLANPEFDWIGEYLYDLIDIKNLK